MMRALEIVIIAGLVLAFGLVERRTNRSPLTGPILFVGAGLLLAGPALGVLPPVPERSLHGFAEATLTLILFADATRIDLRALRRELGLPVRLLLIGMPLTVLAGVELGALLLPELDLSSLLLLAAVLAPTDAALGQAVVSAEGVPQRVRQALNVESGLNDGIAVPLVTLASVMAASAAGLSVEDLGGHRDGGAWVGFVAAQLGLGAAVGIGVGFGGGRLTEWARGRGWSSRSSERLGGLALPALAWGASTAIGGNGFIAAFVGGLTFGAVARDACDPIHAFLETEGELMMLMVFLAFGLSLAWPAIEGGGITPWLYAIGSLTVVRIAPVAFSLIGTGLRPGTVGFVGWFGPRGLASLVFAIQLREIGLPHGEQIFGVAMITVLLSIFAHGLSAAPAAAVYAAHSQDLGEDHPEMRPVAAHRLRRSRHPRG